MSYFVLRPSVSHFCADEFTILFSHIFAYKYILYVREINGQMAVDINQWNLLPCA